MWRCISSPSLVGNEALNLSRRVYFGYLSPSMYVFPMERWLDVYPRKQVHVLDFQRFTDKASRGGYLANFVTNVLGLPGWTGVGYDQVNSLGTFMEAPCFPDGVSYPKLDSAHAKDAIVIHEVQARLAPLNRLLVELLGVELSWTGPTTKGQEGAADGGRVM